MPTMNGYNVGDDLALVVNTATGQLQFNLTDFSADPVTADIKSRPIGSPPVHDVIPDGWQGSFKIDRNSPNVDSYFAALEAAYWQRGSSNVPGTIYQTVREQNGSLSQWRYTKVALKLTKAGDYSGPKKVEQSIHFMSSQKVRVS